MATLTVNTDRFDPYENFKFRIVWDGRAVAGVSKVTALKRTTEVIEFREGGNASNVRKTPGPSKYEPITLEHGVTHDPDFVQWAREVWSSGNADARDGQRRESSLAEVRKDITIELYNEAGQNK